MDGLQHRLEQEMDPATRRLVQQLAAEEGGMSQHTLLGMALANVERSTKVDWAPTRSSPPPAAAPTAPLVDRRISTTTPALATPTLVATVVDAPPAPLRRRKRRATGNAVTAEPVAKKQELHHSSGTHALPEASDDEVQSPTVYMSDGCGSSASPSYTFPHSNSPSFSSYSPSHGSPMSSPYSPTHSMLDTPAASFSPSSNCLPATAPCAPRKSLSTSGGCHSRWLATSSTTAHLPLLPSSIMERVLLLLDTTTLCALNRVSHAMVTPSNDWRVWSTMYVRRWAVTGGREKVNWKLRYREREAQELGATSLNDPLAPSFRALHRARAARQIRARDEFAVLDAWARENRAAWQRMAATPGGVAAHAPTCGQDTCTYTHYPPDLWICRETGFIHFCGSTSDQPSDPISVPPEEDHDEAASSEIKVVAPRSHPIATPHAPPASASAFSRSSSQRSHHCAFLEPSTLPSEWNAALRAARAFPLRACPISLRPSEDAEADPHGDDSGEESLRNVRGDSPEPEEACGRGSFLAACFAHGYNSENIDAAAQVWGTRQTNGDEQRRALGPTRSDRSSELEVIQRGRLFGLALDNTARRHG